MQTLVLPPLTTLNEYINANNRNRFISAKIKKNETEIVGWIAKSTLKPMNKIGYAIIKIYQTNKRGDKDNSRFSEKFIWDGLVWAGIIPNDTWDYVPNEVVFCHYIDKMPKIEVQLYEENVGESTSK